MTDEDRLNWLAANKARVEFSDYLVSVITKERRAHTYHSTPVADKSGNIPDIYPIHESLRRSIDALMSR